MAPPRLDTASLEGALKVTFHDKDLLRQAVVHSSFLNEHPGAFAASNERLEYLGDAVLGLSVAQELYERHGDWPEGEMTRARAELVRGETLARVASDLRLGEYLYLGKGEEGSGGRERPSNLASTFEAVIGAVLLDQGYDVARGVLLGLLSAQIEALSRRVMPTNSKSALLELAQGQGHAPPAYAIVEATGEQHAQTFTAEVSVAGRVVGRGEGSRKADAEQAAARDALEAMRDG